jgi:hypothetical protein
MGNIIVEVPPWFINTGIQRDNETIVKIEPSVNWWQRPAKHPLPILHIDEFPVHDIVITLYIRKVIIAYKISVVVIRGP